ncbi:MAG: ATP-dependent DNA helicase [Methanocellales archaeon]
MEQECLNYFPKPAFYPNQEDVIKRIYHALSKQKIVLLEGACGTGKTLGALVPSLAVSNKKNKKVIIATNVHEQMIQFISEAREIKRKSDIKAIALKGKVHMCPLGMGYEECNVLRENTFELMELEKEKRYLLDCARSIEDRFKLEPSLESARANIKINLSEVENRLYILRKRFCPYLKRILEDGNGDLQTWLFEDVRTPEEVIEKAGEANKCGYELLKRNLKSADLLICNYHHILNSEIFERILAWMDASLQDIILIFDEAHNLESAARVHSSITLSEAMVERAIRECEEVGRDRSESGERVYGEVEAVSRFLTFFIDAIKETYEAKFSFGERERIGEEWYDLIIKEPEDGEDEFFQRFTRKIMREKLNANEILNAMEELGKKMDEYYREQYKLGLAEFRKTSSLLYTARFLSNYLEHANDPEYYQVLNVRRDQNGDINGRIELFSCIPKNITKPIFEAIYAGVLMSATLRPFQMVKTVLGIDRECEELCYGSSFPRENRCTIAVATPPLFAKNRDDEEIVLLIASILNDIIEQCNGNIAIFFPSSSEVLRYKNLLKGNLFIDEAGISSAIVREEFFKMGESGRKAVLLSYLWGTLAEGVNYKDERLRCVVIVGVGYPLLNERMRAIEHAYEHVFGRGWEYAIQNPTIRRIRQAMGRVIRSPSDYGVRVLIDLRYTSFSRKIIGKYSIYHAFPQEEREEFIDVEVDKVKYSLMNFFSDIKNKLQGENKGKYT